MMLLLAISTSDYVVTFHFSCDITTQFGIGQCSRCRSTDFNVYTSCMNCLDDVRPIKDVVTDITTTYMMYHMIAQDHNYYRKTYELDITTYSIGSRLHNRELKALSCCLLLAMILHVTGQFLTEYT